jgi:hypothetical protein
MKVEDVTLDVHDAAACGRFWLDQGGLAGPPGRRFAGTP